MESSGGVCIGARSAAVESVGAICRISPCNPAGVHIYINEVVYLCVAKPGHKVSDVHYAAVQQ